MTDRAPGISETAYRKLTEIKGDFLALSTEDRLAFVEALRARRIRPPAAVKVAKIKEPKPPKPPKIPKEPKEKKPRVKKLKVIKVEPGPFSL